MLGTSRHNSMGTFSVVSLLTASTISNISKKYIPPLGFNETMNNLLQNDTDSYIDTTYFLSVSYTEAKVLAATAIAFWVGIIHCIMFIFQLGFITQYIAEPFIISYTCAYSVHIFTSQLKNVFGVRMVSYNGIFKLPKVIF